MLGFRPGDLILRSKPFACVLEKKEKGQRCDYCFNLNSELKRCSRCHYLYFCDQNCQRKAWIDHKAECQLMQKSPERLSKSLLLISRILLKIKRCGIHEPFEHVLGHKFDFDRLLSHSEKVSEDSVITACGILLPYFQEDDFVSVSKIRSVIGKVRTNTFSILNSNLRSIGGALYLGASIFDHSCDPNAEIVFDGVEIEIRAIKEIPERDASQIYISYIEHVMFREDRQKIFNEQYYFTCKCSRCTTPYYDDLLTQTVVSSSECASQVAAFKEKVADITQMVIDKVEPSIIYETCIEELQKQQNVLSDKHLYHIKVLEFAFDACIDKSQWADAAAIGKQLVKPYILIYGKYNPQVGLHLFKLGKLHNCVGLRDSAKETFLQAEEIIKVTHGEAHPVYRDLIDDNLALM